MNNLPPSNQRLNYVVIICDDIGWGDPGCYGHPSLQTPALDELAREGTRFDAFYAGQPVCSASRVALLTGCMPAKAGVTRLIGSGTGNNRIGSGIHLARHRPTVAQLMQKHGYQTACFGKWHLGFLEPEFSQPPSDFGFDYAFCTVSNSPFKDPDNWHRNGAPLGPLPGYATDIMMADVLRWLREERRPDDPFFLYLPFHAPHEPVGAADEYVARYATEEPPEKRQYYGAVSQMDAACGRLFAALRASGEWDRTMILFTSDHGPEYRNKHSFGSAGPFRGKKLHLYEGGIRVPGILRWPGRTRPGTVCTEPVCNFDILPTLLAAEGAPEEGVPGVDGTSFLPALEERALPRRRPLAWWFPMGMPKGPEGPVLALRRNRWKLLLSRAFVEEQRTPGAEGTELYDLQDDPAETRNRCGDEPERVRTLTEELLAIRAENEAALDEARWHMDPVPPGLENRMA